MNIAFFADRFELGGVETHIISFANQLIRRGHRVLLTTNAAYPELLAQIDATNGCFRYVQWSNDPVNDVKDFAPDIVHAHPFSAIMRGYQVAHQLQKPFIITVHGSYDYALDRSPLGYQVSALVSRVIAVDLDVATLLLDAAAHPEKVCVIRNGIDVNAFSPLPHNSERKAGLGLHPEWFTICTTSRLGDGKELTLLQLLRCTPEVVKQLGGLNILIVGDGPWITRIQEESRAAVNSIPDLNIQVVGRKLDVRPYLAASDLLLACGRSALEAMACQRPVLAAYCAQYGGPIGKSNYRDLLFSLKGCKPLSDEDLVSTLVNLAQDPERLAALAQEGRQLVVRYYDIKDTTTQLERVYRQCLPGQ